MTYYQQAIREEAARLGMVGLNPRHVEALMRCGHPTLDGLSRSRFRSEIRECAAAMATVDEATLDGIAESFGL